jgi:hypothetical protein
VAVALVDELSEEVEDVVVDEDVADEVVVVPVVKGSISIIALEHCVELHA